MNKYVITATLIGAFIVSGCDYQVGVVDEAKDEKESEVSGKIITAFNGEPYPDTPVYISYTPTDKEGVEELNSDDCVPGNSDPDCVSKVDYTGANGRYYFNVPKRKQVSVAVKEKTREGPSEGKEDRCREYIDVANLDQMKYSEGRNTYHSKYTNIFASGSEVKNINIYPCFPDIEKKYANVEYNADSTLVVDIKMELQYDKDVGGVEIVNNCTIFTISTSKIGLNSYSVKGSQKIEDEDCIPNRTFEVSVPFGDSDVGGSFNPTKTFSFDSTP